jgi:hypothetical protein
MQCISGARRTVVRSPGPREIDGHWLPEWKTDPSKIRTDVFYLVT